MEWLTWLIKTNDLMGWAVRRIYFVFFFSLFNALLGCYLSCNFLLLVLFLGVYDLETDKRYSLGEGNNSDTGNYLGICFLSSGDWMIIKVNYRIISFTYLYFLYFSIIFWGYWIKCSVGFNIMRQSRKLLYSRIMEFWVI